MAKLVVLDGGDEGEEEPRPCCSEEYKDRVDAIYQVVPADSADDIASTLGTSKEDVYSLLRHLRQNEVEHGWTVPHVRRGMTVEGDGRYFAELVDYDGKRRANAETTLKVRKGARGTVRHTSTMNRNLSSMLNAHAEYETPAMRRRLRELAADVSYVSRKAYGIWEEFGDGEASNGS